MCTAPMPSASAVTARMRIAIEFCPVNGRVVGVVDAVVDVEVVEVGEVRSQPTWVKVSLSSVTAPLRASALPFTVTPLVTVMEVRARTVSYTHLRAHETDSY